MKGCASLSTLPWEGLIYWRGVNSSLVFSEIRRVDCGFTALSSSPPRERECSVVILYRESRLHARPGDALRWESEVNDVVKSLFNDARCGVAEGSGAA